MGKWNRFHTGILVCILLFIILGLFIFQPDREDFSPYVSFSPAPDGTKAVSLWLEESGVPVQEWNQPWRFLPEEEDHTVLLIQPFMDFSAEREWMLDWLEDGNDLILFDEEPMEWPGFEVEDMGRMKRVKVPFIGIRVMKRWTRPSIHLCALPWRRRMKTTLKCLFRMMMAYWLWKKRSVPEV
ncbi:DUF4350 domain-containing protein [Salicibibacter cibarius]|uniref:DUF4350 domain-containing protein n=1 Tax=Salicibibacter cibarius TaxID=2743000 RepID=A0A7T7CD42_9BACI|nr:DUF4350 domain-containing protein [Salicibibacter cibarius]QQK77585.1 DUF4350 domain-containing protein [Salicibibacter cibarius]